jgi:hypothetical protein
MSGKVHALVLSGLVGWIALALEASAQVDPKVHQQCLKAADYKGCVDVMTGKQASPATPGKIDQLKSAMRILPSRLQNTNLRDFSSNTQVFNDAVSSIVPDDLKSDYEKEFYGEAVKIRQMTDALQSYWSARIHQGTFFSKTRYGSDSYFCPVLKSGLDLFNAVAGDKYVVAYNGSTQKGFFGSSETCYPQESDLVRSISRRVDEALVDPEVRKAELARKKREAELSRMAPWDRHLEENPQLKAWVKANPAQAEKAREKFLADLEKKNSEKKADYSDLFKPQ